MHKIQIALGVFVCILGLLAPSTGLKCFVCNSFHNETCGDPFDKDSPELQKNYLKECDVRNYTDENGTVYATIPKEKSAFILCKKIYQDIHPDPALKGSPDIRIVRQCGFAKYHRNCYNTALKMEKTYVCQCEGDMCNSAPWHGNPGPISVAMSMAIALLVIKS